VFPKKDQAIDYAQNRACFRSGEIRVLDSTGNIELTKAPPQLGDLSARG
jgi:hypothetical protein